MNATLAATSVRGIALLIAVGALFGLSAPLSKVAAELESHPIGLTIWVNAFIATICLAGSAMRGRLPRVDRSLLRFVLWWGLFGSVIGKVLLFWIVEHLAASTISIVIVCEGLIVYALSALGPTRVRSSRTLSGILLGLFGTCALIVVSESHHGSAGAAPWMLIAFGVPLAFAAEDLLLAHRLPPDLDIVAGTGLSAATGALMLLPVAWSTDDFIAMAVVPARIELAILGLAVSSSIGTMLLVRLLSTTGAISGSQAGYTITLFGILWSMLLLGEQPRAGLWLALVLLAMGAALVDPVRRSGQRERAGFCARKPPLHDGIEIDIKL